MITFLQAMPIGNAVSCLLAHPEGTVLTRVLRKMADDFTGEADPAAGVVYEGLGVRVVDIDALANGQTYYYKAYHFDGAAWTATETFSVTPAATAERHGPDVLEIVRTRLEAGLKAEVVAGRLTHASGYIPCYTAPPLFETTRWPVVSVHMQNDAAAQRGLGEIVSPDEYDAIGEEWDEAEGWLAGVKLLIIGWSLNADERNLLRLAIQKVIIGNLSVFDGLGLGEVSLSQNDVDDMESYGAPVYSTLGNFDCLAAVSVDSTSPPISDVTVAASAI